MILLCFIASNIEVFISETSSSISSLTNAIDSPSVVTKHDIILDDAVYIEDQDDSDLDVLEFDVKSKVGRLPDSSYTDQETLFTWSDITGDVSFIVCRDFLYFC